MESGFRSTGWEALLWYGGAGGGPGVWGASWGRLGRFLGFQSVSWGSLGPFLCVWGTNLDQNPLYNWKPGPRRFGQGGQGPSDTSPWDHSKSRKIQPGSESII